MPREDFELLTKYMTNNLPIDYSWDYFANGDIWGTIRVSDKRHIIKREFLGKDYYLNPNIDIFPIDGLPANRIMRRVHLFNVYIHYALFRSTQIKYLDLEKKRPLIERMIIKTAMMIPVKKFIDKQKALKDLTHTLKKYSYSESDYVFSFYSAYRKKTIVPKNYYGNGADIMFENISFKGPLEYGEILTKEYGNYMKLPPIEERRSKHHLEFIS